MWAVLLEAMFMVLLALAAAWFISCAVREFKEQKWFLFGLDSTFAMWEIALLIKHLIA